MPNVTREELAEALKLLADIADVLPSYMDWAQVWHRQAGGYTASDTAMTIMRMERIFLRVAEWKANNLSRLDAEQNGGGE